jgi:hypothetical protein
VQTASTLHSLQAHLLDMADPEGLQPENGRFLHAAVNEVMRERAWLDSTGWTAAAAAEFTVTPAAWLTVS